MKRFFVLAIVVASTFSFGTGLLATVFPVKTFPGTTANGQGIGRTDSYPYYYNSYGPHPAYPVQVRPSAYAYGYTYTSPYTYYPLTPRYYSHYRYPFRYPTQVIRRGRVSTSRSVSPFGSAHSSHYFGNPHASQYLGR